MANRIIGWESANSYVKVKSEDSFEAYFNSLWRIPELGYQSDVTGGKSKEQVFTIDGASYKVGTRNVGHISSSSRSEDRYNSPEYKRESLIALARHSENGDDLTAVTAVPADHYKSDQVHMDIEKAIKGIHTVSINGVPKVITVKKVKAILQPVATVFSLAFKPDGSIQAPELIKNRKVIVDIGWGTTDIAVMQGMELILSFTVDVSMLDAYEYMDQVLRKEHKRLRTAGFTLFDLEGQLRDSDEFQWGGVSYDAKDVKEKAYNETASAMLARVSNHVKLTDFDLTLFGGGGVVPLADHFKRHVEDVNAKKVPNPQLANAFGCYLYGKFKK